MKTPAFVVNSKDVRSGTLKARALGCQCVGRVHDKTCRMREWLRKQRQRSVSTTK